MPQPLERELINSQNFEPTSEVTSQPRNVQDLLDLMHRLYKAGSVVRIYHGLKEARLIKRGASIEDTFSVIKAGIEAVRADFEEAVEPSFKQALTQIELPFPEQQSRIDF